MRWVAPRSWPAGTARERLGLARALKACAAGDVLVVWRLDRLGRSLGHLIELLHGLAARGVQFRSPSEHIDTATPTGKLTFHVIGALADDAECTVMRSDAVEIHEPRGFRRCST